MHATRGRFHTEALPLSLVSLRHDTAFERPTKQDPEGRPALRDRTALPRVLVVSPDSSIRHLLCYMLGASGKYRCDAVSYWDQAHALCQNNAYEIVIVDDFERTSQAALACLEQLRSFQGTQQARTLVCTLIDHPAEHEVFWQAGADACLTKPFAMRTLLDSIDKLAA